MEQNFEEEVDRLQRRIELNRQEERRTRLIYDAADRKEAEDLNAQMQRHRIEERRADHAGMSTDRRRELQKANHREEGLWEERRRKNLERANAHLRDQAAKHREEEDVMQKGIDERRQKIAALREHMEKKSFNHNVDRLCKKSLNRDWDIWKKKHMKPSGSEEARRHCQQASKKGHRDSRISVEEPRRSMLDLDALFGLGIIWQRKE